MLEHIFRPIPKEDKSLPTTSFKETFSASDAARFYEEEKRTQQSKTIVDESKVRLVVKNNVYAIKTKMQEDLREKAKTRKPNEKIRWIIVSHNFNKELENLDVNYSALENLIADELNQHFPGFQKITVESKPSWNLFTLTFDMKP